MDVAGKEATCTEDGLTAGKKCSVCGEVLVAQEVIPAKGHTEVDVAGKEATCTEDGLTAGKKCSVCGEVLVAQEVIPAKGHTEVVVAGKEATCTEDGLTAGKKCSVCGEVLVAQEVISAKGHTEVAVPGKEATCTEDGLTAGKKCSVCGEFTVKQEIIPATNHKATSSVVFYTKGENPVAIVIATNKNLGTLVAGEGIEALVQGNFYVVNSCGCTNTAVADLGAAVADKQVTAGWTNVLSNGRVQNRTSWLMKTVSLKNFTLNSYMDEAALNSAMGAYASMGKFGTVTLTNVDGKNAALVFDGTGEAKLITDYKWNFVYASYDGSGLNVATGTTWTPLAMNHMELIRTAIDFALNEEAGYSRDIWVSAMDTYGGLPSIVTLDGKYNGTTIQVNNTNVWNNSIIPVRYTAALKNYEALEDSDEVIAEKLAAAEKALADAQKALDEAVAANANVAALKAAMNKAEKALDAAKQAEYDAKVAYETEKASSGINSEASVALKAVYDEKTAKKNSAQAEYDAAKAAYDEAVNADEALKALAAALTDATNAHKTAEANQKKVDTYKEYAPLYEAFLAEYSKAANVALWDVNNMEESAIVKAFGNVPEDQRALPTYTYYYDAETDTYTVFVTSATDKNTIEKFTDNTPIKPYHPEAETPTPPEPPVNPPETSDSTTATTTPIIPPATSDSVTTTTPTVKPGTSDTTTVTPGASKYPGYEDVDFGGYTFKFAGNINTTDGWKDYEVYAADDEVTYITDMGKSVSERNQILKELYNCNIEIVDIADGVLASDFATGSHTVDFVNQRYNLGSKANGQYYNLHTLGIDLEKPWWNQGFIEDATVDGALYGITGAFSLTDFDATWVLFFNNAVKESNEALKDVDFYELVRNNEWTLDKFYELVKLAMYEDGDSLMTTQSGDVFGLVSSTFGIRGLYFGSGNRYTYKTDSKTGESTFTHGFNNNAVVATDMIIDIYYNSASAVSSYTVVEKQFRGEKTLFAPEVLKMAYYYAGVVNGGEKEDYGILPHPKLNANQVNYAHTVDNHMIYLTVPKTTADIDDIAKFLELYAYHSYYTVYEDYLDYHAKLSGKQETAEMLDIILRSKVFDLGYQFGWGQVDSQYISNTNNGKNSVAQLGDQSGPAMIEAAGLYKETIAKYINVPAPEIKKNTDEIFADAGYDINKYVKIELTPVLHAYYNSSSDNTNLTVPGASSLISAANGYNTENVRKFYATGIIDAMDIPVGSVIVVKKGYIYRPDGWTAENVKNEPGTRPSNVSDSIVVVDEAWKAGFTLRAFNVSREDGADITAYEFGSLAIYVPKLPDVYVDIDFENNTATDAMGNVDFVNKGENITTGKFELFLGNKKTSATGINIQSGSWVKATFNKLADANAVNAFAKENGGFTLEVFYANRTNDSVVGIVCATEGNGKNGKQGFGIADSRGCPYFITGAGKAYATTIQTTVKVPVSTLVHVVGVYDAVNAKVLLYINGEFVKSAAAADFKAADETEIHEQFNMANVFYLGGDPTVSSKVSCDYPAKDLIIVDTKIYAGVLNADQVYKTYVEAVNDVEAGTKRVVFVSMGETPKAVDIATNEVITGFTVSEGIGEVKGGYFYLMETVGEENTIVSEIGAAVANKQVTAGWTNVKTNGSLMSYNSYIIRGNSLKTLTLNGYMDEAAFNTSIGKYASIGKFGTVTLTNVDGKNAALVFDGTGEAKLITDYKWNFVYVNYDGSGFNVATGTTWTPLAMNHMELIRTATDFALGKENGYSRKLWVSAMDTYMVPYSIATVDGKYNGVTIQNQNVNNWNNSIIPVKYTAALKNYEALEDSDEVIAEKLAAAEKALADAQKALDEAVAANANVAALKATMDKAAEELEAAKQAEYEARVAYETERVNSGINSEASVALKTVYSEKTAEKNSAQSAYNTAKTEYDAAVSADEALASLNTALTDATNAYKTAEANQKKVDTYKEYAPLYEAFLAEYSKAANVALWDVNNMEESAIVKAFANIPENQRALPTYTYYYDAKTDTYTVFVTSATDKNTIEKFTNNIAIKPYDPEN
ncbi:MAG: hypothetical protein IJV67_01950 [Clostridia bacterium]|nr:hypothetical protein [Clostridia bacterium]